MIKRLFCVLLLAALGVAQAPAPGPQAQPGTPSLAATPQDENQAKARAVLDQMIAALGGQAYLSYQDMSQEGRTYSFYQGQPQGAGNVFWRFWKWPDKDRFEYTKQRDVVQIYNGDNAYEVTFRGTAFIPKDKSDDFQRRRAHSMEQVLRTWLKMPGTVLFYEGQSMAEQKIADRITIMIPSNDAVTILVDLYTHLPTKKIFIYRDPLYRDHDEDAEIWGNYRAIQGIATPFIYTRTHNGEIVTQRYLSAASYNLGLPDTLFTPQHPPPGNLKK